MGGILQNENCRALISGGYLADGMGNVKTISNFQSSGALVPNIFINLAWVDAQARVSVRSSFARSRLAEDRICLAHLRYSAG